MTVLSARGAGVRHHRRWLVRDLDLTVEPGETVAVVGPPGSGRTSTLLLLAGRLRSSAGTVSLPGTAVLAQVTGVNDPEPAFTVREHVQERLALLGRPRREAGAVALHGLDPELHGRELTPYQKQVLGLVLAGLARPAVIALDGVDAGLDARERTELWGLLGTLAAAGTTILVTAREVDPARVTRVVRLSDPQTAEPGRAVVQTADEYAATLTGWPFGASAALLHAPVDEPAQPVDSPVDETQPVDAPVDETQPADDDEPADDEPADDDEPDDDEPADEPADDEPVDPEPVDGDSVRSDK
ncbi:ABC-2 type transport system ATP-binding protein [Actinoplanes octamycinicus]|uniref:ABC-2 type transport system ATP-binding protein n=1 Tax=Actinoplanes octamycinicus TaxID=135948 RepID=A0A7W7GRH6_9ACTN|nr:ATP-binding cassette domain-containing protein [Actinoplanes octamycinicus]MBB4736963.1 ABC-2 type transport system ATP-binding protein [Actinoplanes octamycinicus]GIE62101.1 hypothetical protein Aoc01nite_75030 [Actinoplanes octamycinicus]